MLVGTPNLSRASSVRLPMTYTVTSTMAMVVAMKLSLFPYLSGKVVAQAKATAPLSPEKKSMCLVLGRTRVWDSSSLEEDGYRIWLMKKESGYMLRKRPKRQNKMAHRMNSR